MSNQRGRSSETGQFIPVREALRRPATTTVETISRPTRPVTKPSSPPPRKK